MFLRLFVRVEATDLRVSLSFVSFLSLALYKHAHHVLIYHSSTSLRDVGRVRACVCFSFVCFPVPMPCRCNVRWRGSLAELMVKASRSGNLRNVLDIPSEMWERVSASDGGIYAGGVSRT